MLNHPAIPTGSTPALSDALSDIWFKCHQYRPYTAFWPDSCRVNFKKNLIFALRAL